MDIGDGVKGVIGVIVLLALLWSCSRSPDDACAPVYDNGDQGTYTVPKDC